MAQPTPYNRLYDFSDYQEVNPTKPLRGSEVDAELNAIKLTTDQIRANAALIQRDDGALANQSVTPDSLSAGALAMIHQGEYNPRGAWAGTTVYRLGDVVTYNAATYLCIVAHTAQAAFPNDLALNRWLLIANGALTGQASAIDLFEGNGTTTAYTLTYNYVNSNAAVVFVSGVAQIPVQDFTISGATLTFVVAPPAPSVGGRKNIMVRGAAIEVQLVADAAAASATAAAGSALAASNSAASADASEAQALASKNAAAVSEANANDDAAATASAVAQAVDGEKDLFVAGVGYTKGTTTQLTLSYTPAKSGTVKVFFDGVFQHLTEWSLAGNVITFTAAIPSDKVEVHYVIPSQFVGLSNADLLVLGDAQVVAQAGATTATTQAGIAATQVGLAVTARVGAESARDAALIQAGVYATEAAGRAAVADGVAFKVQGSGDVAAYEYRRTNSTTSVLIATYPSAAAVANGTFVATVETNKFNPALVVVNGGYINTSGVATGAPLYKNSGYQPVLPSTAYLLTGVEAGNNWGLAAYDVNKAFITMLPTAGQNIAAIPQTFTTPVNCYYLRWTIQVGASPDYTNLCMLEQTSSIYPSVYVPYARTVDISQIPTDIARKSDVDKPFGRVTIKNSDRILIVGNSYTEGVYVIRGKHYVPTLSMLSDYQVVNYGKSAATLASLYTYLEAGTVFYGFSPSANSVTYAVIACIQNNSGTSDQYYSDLIKLVRKLETMGARVILSTEHNITNDGYAKALKAFAYQENLMFCDWRVFADATKTVAFNQFNNSGHPGTRSTWAWVSGIKPYLDTLPAPQKSIKLFRDRYATSTIGSTNLFNTALASNSGFVQLGGALSNGGSTYNNSGYQAVSGLALYQLSGFPLGGGWGLAAYDSSYNFITMLPTNGGWLVTSPQQFLTPSNCAYLRWTTRFAGTDYTSAIALNTVTLNNSYSSYAGINLYDDTKASYGYISNSGTLANSAQPDNPTGFWNSGFQAVSASTSYLLSGIPLGTYFAYYDSSKAVISAQLLTASPFVTPSNCAFIRWTVGFYSGDQSSSCMLEQTTSSTPSSYVSFTGISKLAYEGVTSRAKLFTEIEVGHSCYTAAAESGYDNADIAGTYDVVTDEYSTIASRLINFGKVMLAEITLPCSAFDSARIVVNASGVTKAYLLNETLLWKEVPIESGVIRLWATDSPKYLKQGKLKLILTGTPTIVLTDIYADYQGTSAIRPKVKAFKDRTVSGTQLLTATTVNDADTAWTGITGVAKYTPVLSRSSSPEPLPSGITTVRLVSNTVSLVQSVTLPVDSFKETVVRVKVLCRYFPTYILNTGDFAANSLIKRGTYDCADLNVTLNNTSGGSIVYSEPIGLWWDSVVIEFISLGGAATLTIASADTKNIQIAKVELLV